MSLLDVFFSRQKKEDSAAIARERLQILVTHQRSDRATPDYLPAMKKDILEVVSRYVTIDQDNVSVTFENNEHLSVLEVEVTLPDNSTTKVSIA